MKILLIFLLALVTFTLPLSGCGYSEAELTEAYTEAYDEGYMAGYAKGYDEGWASVLTKGSVLEYNGGYLEEKVDGHYRFRIIAKVQNVGAGGVITVFAEITPQDVAYEGRNLESIEVYLRQGEDKELTFRFWVKWPNEGLYSRVWSVP